MFAAGVGGGRGTLRDTLREGRSRQSTPSAARDESISGSVALSHERMSPLIWSDGGRRHHLGGVARWWWCWWDHHCGRLPRRHVILIITYASLCSLDYIITKESCHLVQFSARGDETIAVCWRASPRLNLTLPAATAPELPTCNHFHIKGKIIVRQLCKCSPSDAMLCLQTAEDLQEATMKEEEE